MLNEVDILNSTCQDAIQVKEFDLDWPVHQLIQFEIIVSNCLAHAPTIKQKPFICLLVWHRVIVQNIGDLLTQGRRMLCEKVHELLRTLLVKSWLVHVNSKFSEGLVGSLVLLVVAEDFPQFVHNFICFVHSLPHFDYQFC